MSYKTPNLVMNFLPLDVSTGSFLSYISNYESKESLTQLREKYPTCVFSRRGSKIFCIPYTGNEHFGNEKELDVSNNHNIICKLILDNLQRHLISNGRKIVRLNPLSFIDTNHDLIKESSFSEKLQGFHIYPKFTLNVKPIKNRDGTITFGILIDISAYFDISLSVKILSDRNISLNNMYLDVKSLSKIKDNDWIHRHMIGQLNSIEHEIVNLADYKEKANVSASECFPEPRKDNFNHLLQSILGPDYSKLKSELQEKLQEFIGGNGKVQLATTIVDEIKKIPDKKISNELSFSPHDELLSIGEQSTVGFIQVPKPTYVYDPAKTKTHNWHNGGLNLFGPFDLESFHRKNPRVVVITPKNYQGEVEKFLNSFKNGIPGKGYYQQGFVRKYHLNDMTFDFVTFDSDSADVAKPYRETCLSALEGEPYDLALVIIEEKFHEKTGDDDPYLVAKSIFMSHAVPVQEIEIETIRQWEGSWPYILDNIALASYVKMGGTPWTISAYDPLYHELIIGMGTALISDGRLSKSKRYVGITNVFGSDGSYLLSNISKEINQDNYRDELLQSLKSCIEYVAKRNAWQPNDHVRLIFHQQFREFRNEDIEIIKDFISSLGEYDAEFAFVHLTERHQFQIFDKNQDGVVIKFDKEYSNTGKIKGQLTAERGYVVQIDSRNVLLTLTGPNQLLTRFQGIPKPLQISLHRDSTFTDINYIAKQVFHFTFLNWRGFNPTSIPVTISYSNLIASLLGRLKNVSNWNSDIIRTKLRYSRWFL